MSTLSKEEIEELAKALSPRIVEDIRNTQHNFWIDPETHYNDHQRLRVVAEEELYELKELVKLYKATKTLWFKMFIGLAVVGTVIIVGLLKVIGR